MRLPLVRCNILACGLLACGRAYLTISAASASVRSLCARKPANRTDPCTGGFTPL